MRRIMMSAAAVVLGIAVGAATAGAQSMLRLPNELKLTRSADSPGQVTFDHTTHVDSAKPACVTCHSREFNILKASPRREIKHENFDKGRQCGACHDGNKAFKVEEDCTFCHREP